MGQELHTVTTRPAPGVLTPICDECAKAEGVSNDTYGTGCGCSVCHERLTCGWGKLVNEFPPSAEGVQMVVMTWVPWTDPATGR